MLHFCNIQEDRVFLTSLHLVLLHIDWPVNHRWLKVLSRKQPCLTLPSMPGVRHTLSTDNPFRHCIFYQPYRVYGRKTMQKTSWGPPAPYLFATALPCWLLSSTFCFEMIWWPSFLLSTNFHSNLWKDLISRWHVIYHTWPLDLQTTSKDGTFGAEEMQACELPQLKICCYIEFHITHYTALDKQWLSLIPLSQFNLILNIEMCTPFHKACVFWKQNQLLQIM